MGNGIYSHNEIQAYHLRLSKIELIIQAYHLRLSKIELIVFNINSPFYPYNGLSFIHLLLHSRPPVLNGWYPILTRLVQLEPVDLHSLS
ncbi:hypothetical protein HanXRQr2_Chr11g0496031 [Helianthus annuus]|uniref:Uncharacterized protein n=1 Tax=Helianthus annuus TaxID=4232 RepID=A0A9K3N0H5_HELAN|nr:hypothetical protein HanXRQr2_Chr11g0496031 [Helianthus annuus]KAJ0875579.1 hypothetical protein HanPSC8_Chr11g0478071 [Helianthus annuus]